MLASVRDQIITQFVDRLSADGKPDGVMGVYRSRTQPAVRDESIPGIFVAPRSEQILADAHESQLRTLGIHVVCLFGSPGIDDETIDQKVEPLTNWVEACLAQDETFDGLAIQSQVSGITWHIDAADEDYIGAEMSVEVLYSTARNAPDTRL